MNNPTITGSYKLTIAGVIIIVLIVLSACAPTPDIPLETPVVACYGFTDGLPILSANPCLRGPYTTDTSIGIIQAVPDGWTIHNVLANADGNVDDTTGLARITASAVTMELHDAVNGVNGAWGYSQDVNLSPGCHLWKVSGRGWINNPPHPDNYVIAMYVDGVLVGGGEFPMQDEFEMTAPFTVEHTGSYNIRFAVSALWGSSGSSSTVDILGAGVLEVSDDYCDNPQ